MYYSDDKYKNIPVPESKQSDIYLRVYNGKSFVLSKEKQLAFKKQEIFNRLDNLEKLMLKNNTRYKHRENWSEYDKEYTDEIKKLESQLESL